MDFNVILFPQPDGPSIPRQPLPASKEISRAKSFNFFFISASSTRSYSDFNVSTYLFPRTGRKAARFIATMAAKAAAAITAT